MSDLNPAMYAGVEDTSSPEDELTEQENTRYHLDIMIFGVAYNLAAFLLCSFSFYCTEKQQRSGSCCCSLRLSRVSITTAASAPTFAIPSITHELSSVHGLLRARAHAKQRNSMHN